MQISSKKKSSCQDKLPLLAYLRQLKPQEGKHLEDRLKIQIQNMSALFKITQ